MSKWRIELIGVGRGKATYSVEAVAVDLPSAENIALKECGKHLMSREVSFADKCDLTYTVFAGFHSVGKVKITSI